MYFIGIAVNEVYQVGNMLPNFKFMNDSNDYDYDYGYDAFHYYYKAKNKILQFTYL